MGDITLNFSWWEFRCRCGCEDSYYTVQTDGWKIEREHVEYLQILRYQTGLPIYIINGYRCEAYNREVGGVKKSRHLLGIASDIRVPSMGPVHVARAAAEIPAFFNGGIGVYVKRRYVHLDCRKDHKARWGDKWRP